MRLATCDLLPATCYLLLATCNVLLATCYLVLAIYFLRGCLFLPANFFGEGLLWWGSALVAVAGLTAPGADASFALYGSTLAVISPIWSTFFLFFTSL